jgi:hypothetical protein
VKKASDALFVLAVVLLVVAIALSSAPLYVLAGVALVGSIVTTSVKRRRAKAAKSA